ncbi:MAG: nucleoside-triphosphatase [Eubacteriales bacterium]|nr:nucleoside-triphosphatase [Eubacteriales bacterium]
MLEQRLQLLSSQKEAMSKLEDLYRQQAGFSTILLTGKSGSGKSTVVQEFLRDFSASVRGYTTVRHRSTEGKRVAFQHILLPASVIPSKLTIEYPDQLPTDIEYFLYRDKDKVEFDRESFLKLADYMSPEQVYQDETPELMLWDEVGGEELLIDRFYETLIYWLEQDEKPGQIIVWKKGRDRSNVRLAHLSREEMDLLDQRRRKILDHPSIRIHDVDAGDSTVLLKKNSDLYNN